MPRRHWTRRKRPKNWEVVEVLEELKAAIEALRLAIVACEHPEGEAAAIQAALEVQYAMNALLESNVVVSEGIIRLQDGKAAALMRINGGVPVLARLQEKQDGFTEAGTDRIEHRAGRL